MLYDPKFDKQITVQPLKPWRFLLQQAASLIEKNGWAAGAYSRNGRYCMLGALQKAGGFNPGLMSGALLSPTYWRAKAKLRKYLGRGVVNYNDRVCAGKQHAVNILLRVAQKH